MSAGVLRRREKSLTLALLFAGALLALVAARASRVSVEGAVASSTPTPVAAALAFVALVGTGTMLFVGSNGRRVIAALLMLVGAGIVAAMLWPTDVGWFAYQSAENAGAPAARRSAWAWTGAASGVALVVIAAVAIIRARNWPGPRALPSLAARADPGLPPEPERPGSTWDRIDRGEDPTV